MTSIQNFYKSVLSALSYSVGEDNLISFVEPGGGVMPATAEGKRLILPTKEVLREGIDDSLQAFHPISENIARKGASPVLAHMQRAAKALIAYYLSELSIHLLKIASDQSLHKAVPPGFTDFLKRLSDADKKTLTDFVSLMEKAVTKNKLVTIYLKNGAKINGKDYNRACVIHFPIVDLLKNEEEAPLGVKIRKRDRKVLLNLFEIILPNITDGIDAYSVGSNGRVAPYLDSFLRAYGKVIGQYNKIIRRFSLLDLELKEFDITYMEDIENLSSFHGKIPSLKGNEGVGDQVENTETKPVTEKLTSKINTETPKKKQPIDVLIDDGDVPPWEEVKTPAVQTTVAEETTTGITLDDLKKAMNPQQTQQVYQQPSPYGNRGFVQTPQVHPMFSQQQAPSPFAAALGVSRGIPPSNHQSTTMGYPYGYHNQDPLL